MDVVRRVMSASFVILRSPHCPTYICCRHRYPPRLRFHRKSYTSLKNRSLIYLICDNNVTHELRAEMTACVAEIFAVGNGNKPRGKIPNCGQFRVSSHQSIRTTKPPLVTATPLANMAKVLPIV